MPIGRDSRMLLVFAARKEMKRFQQFEVRRRLKRWQVLPFKTEEVTAQLKQAVSYTHLTLPTIYSV